MLCHGTLIAGPHGTCAAFLKHGQTRHCVACWSGAVRRDGSVICRSGLFHSRLFHALGVGLRGGGLTGRRAVALAAPLRRGCLGHIGNHAVEHRPYGTIFRRTKNNRATSEARPSGRRPVRAPPRRPAHQRGIAVSEIDRIPKIRPDHTVSHQQHSTISHGTKNNRATSEARPSGRRPVRAPSRRPAHQRGIAVSETNSDLKTTAPSSRTAPAKHKTTAPISGSAHISET